MDTSVSNVDDERTKSNSVDFPADLQIFIALYPPDSNVP